MKDIVYTRKYTDREGQERKEYINVGYLFEKEGKLTIRMKPWINLGAMANEKGDVWLSVYEHKTKEQVTEAKNLYKGAETVKVVQEAVQHAATQEPQPMTAGPEDDCPF